VIDPDYRRQYVFKDNALQLVSPVITLHLPKSGADMLFPVDQMFTEMDEED